MARPKKEEPADLREARMTGQGSYAPDDLTIEQGAYDPNKAYRWIRKVRPDGKSPDNRRKLSAKKDGWTPVEGHYEHDDLVLCKTAREHAEELQAKKDEDASRQVEPLYKYQQEHEALTRGRKVAVRINVTREAPTEASFAQRERKFFDMGR